MSNWLCEKYIDEKIFDVYYSVYPFTKNLLHIRSSIVTPANGKA